MTSSTPDSSAPNTRFVAGTIWMVAMRWAMRFVGFFSSIILARLLAPEDFGLVAMAMIVVALVDALSDSGVDLALIRERDSEKKLYNAAWTIQVIQGIFVAAVMLGSIPVAVSYFGEPKLTMIISLLALGHFLYSFKNIGTVQFRKELDFAREFRFLVSVRLLSFISTVGLAFWLRDYRAIVYGMLLKSLYEVALSYLMHSYRPGFTFSGMKQIWGFSQWLLASSVIGVANSKASQFVVGSSLGTTALGFYYMASEVGAMFVQEIVMPMGRGLFPNLSLLQDDKVKFTETCIKMLGVVAMLCLPVGFGLSLVSLELITLFFGQKWAGSAPILEWTALGAAVASISASLNLVLMVKKKLNLTTMKAAIEFCVLIPLLLWVGGWKDPVLVAMAKLSVTVLFFPLTIGFVGYVLQCHWTRLALPLWKPCSAVAVMFVVDHLLLSGIQFHLITNLALHILVGVFSYALSLYLLWLVSGKPESAEKTVFEIAARFLKRLI